MFQSEHENNSILIRGKLISYFLLFGLTVLSLDCNNEAGPVAASTPIATPRYGPIRLITLDDTLHFPLGDNAYNQVKSFNYFITGNNTSYLSFYDNRSESIILYNFHTQQLVKSIRLKKSLKEKKLYKVSVYTQNFDSIYVTNFDQLHLMDSSGKVKKSIRFFEGFENMAYYETPVPVVSKNGKIYMALRPFVKETDLSAVRKWKALCEFDFNTQTKKLLYPLPPVYRKGLYGRRFLAYSYCYNDKGNFVFSFPADSNIYETNLEDHHLAWFAKSRFQHEPILEISKKALDNKEGAKEYTLRDSYGEIYFDPYRKRYLRFAKQKMSKEAFEAKNYQRTYSCIVMDQNFSIIGEFPFKNEFSKDDIFFTPDGSIYTRTLEKDENALHFVRLSYDGEENKAIPLTKR